MLIGGILALSAVLAVLIYTAWGSLWALPLGFVGAFVLLAALAFVFLWAACRVVDTSKPQEKDSPFYRGMTWLYIDAILKATRIRVHTQGLENTPKDGRFLLVCNHTSDADPAILLSAFPKSQLAFISKRENKDMFLVGKLMHQLMCQLVNRENDREALKTILKCIQLIQDDVVSIGVFPEGYIHEDRKLHHFRHGVFKIAQKAKVPIVVCTLKDTYPVFQNARHLKPSDVYLNLLTVIPAEEVVSHTTVELGQRIYDMMSEDLGPERVSLEENT